MTKNYGYMFVVESYISSNYTMQDLLQRDVWGLAVYLLCFPNPWNIHSKSYFSNLKQQIPLPLMVCTFCSVFAILKETGSHFSIFDTKKTSQISPNWRRYIDFQWDSLALPYYNLSVYYTTSILREILSNIYYGGISMDMK